VTRLLVEKGADVAAQTYDGWTALHLAAENGPEAAMVRLLKPLEKNHGWRAIFKRP